MQLANSTTRYGAVPQLIHWLTALFVIGGWLLGRFGDDLPKDMHHFGLFVHMTLGEGVITLLVIRLFWRVANPPPPAEPTPLGRLVTLAGKFSHFALYALLLAVPLLGIIVQLKRGHDLPIFGIGEFASPWPADRAIARSVLFIHYWSANALLILAGVHAAAAIVHHWLWKDRTMVRMLPGAA